ncbi:GAF domain-containing protein [Lacticaseibacillus camelliae]|uniref:GAF domain-containing protein n=1 Tax=Lacticaseibacillus camelliae DSM 22697 = JCM 13995 TaxID=1423730 RepID=A0A0R2FB03_9LACO|nr:GAF domain-containing protein [Lacticaseibacillus camelliae]KRN25278.1 GAF domain-containing protein [Lacticaseibacillus camelliae DSM 22697 = JCM 13995]
MTAIDPLIVDQVAALLAGEDNVITNLSNAAALLYNSMDQVNWAGFYLYSERRDSLDLGPFQGQVACTHIQPGSGVVGTSYEKQTPLRVPNVHEFAGHIACDAASNSECVVPLQVNGRIIGIMDIDSPVLDRFSDSDVKVLTDFGAALAKHLDAAALSAIY